MVKTISKKSTISKAKSITIEGKTSKTGVKKVAKKAIAKKVAVKKVINKAPAKKKAVKKVAPKKKLIRQEQYFFLKDGTIIKSIEQLAKIMDEMHDDTFYHHVNDERHDFANWINDVFEEVELANQLMEAERHKEKNHYIVLKYIIKQ